MQSEQTLSCESETFSRCQYCHQLDEVTLPDGDAPRGVESGATYLWHHDQVLSGAVTVG